MNFRVDLEKNLSLSLSDEQIKQFHVYYEFLIDYNRKVNLTSITEEKEVYYKHFFDSLTAAKYINFNEIKTVCDMGSGAGFPSIPLKIMFPHLEVSIIDALNKRLIFLKELVDKIDLSHVNFYHDRIEKFALSHQNTFDLVTARALGDMSLISELGLPMTKIGGHFLAFKGQNIQLELDKSHSGIEILGGKLNATYIFELPYEYGTRSLIHIIKRKDTKGYPRNFQLIKNKPL